MIYLDNAATTTMSDAVKETIKAAIDKYEYNPSSAYQPGQDSAAAIARARNSIEARLDLPKNSLIFTGSGSEADSMAIKSVLGFKRGRIITSPIEHHAILRACEFMSKMGFDVVYTKVNSSGTIDLDDFRTKLTSDTVLVSVMAANNELGTIEPINELAAITKSIVPNAIFHTDSVQAIGEVNLNANLIDMISYSAHKIHGPKGIGGLYIKPEVRKRLTALVNGGRQEFGIRGGTENTPYILAFATAINELFEKNKQINALKKDIRELIKETVVKTIPDVQVNEAKERLSGTLSLTFNGIDASALAAYLDLEGYCVSTGSACNTGSSEPSHVLTAIGLTKSQAFGTIRISVGTDINVKDIENFIKILNKYVEKLKEMALDSI